MSSRHAGIVAAILAGCLAAPAARTSTEFDRLFALYRGTGADQAIELFAAWPEGVVTRDAVLSSEQDDPRTLAALALFHTEAGQHRDTFGGLPAAARSATLPSIREVHYQTSLELVERLGDVAKRTGDEALLAFCRNWYLAVHQAGLTAAYVGPGLPLERTPSIVEDSAELQTAYGAGWVRRMGPRSDVGPYNYMTDLGAIGVKPAAGTVYANTPTLEIRGEVYLAREARYAELAFRRALDDDAGAAPARLRLGRLLQTLNRLKDARPELERAARDGALRADAPTVYLSQVFLGELAESEGRLDGAAIAYRQAIATLPSGSVASLALGRLLISNGDADAGWTAMRGFFDDVAQAYVPARDPWTDYPHPVDPDPEARWVAMRAFVSRTPYVRQASAPTPAVTVARGDGRVSGPANVPPVLSGGDDVRIDLLATDKERPLDGLTDADVVVLENGARQAATVVPARSLALVLVVDTSASMLPEAGGVAIGSLARTVTDALQPGDTISIVAVSDRPALLADAIDNQAQARKIAAKVQAQGVGTTALWDTVLASQSLVARAAARPVVVVISDGGDTNSYVNRKRALAALERSGTIVDGIEVPLNLGHCRECAADRPLGPVRLREMGLATGGVVFDAGDATLAARLAERFATLRQSFVVTYHSQTPAPVSGWRNIKVRLRPGLSGQVQVTGGGYAWPDER